MKNKFWMATLIWFAILTGCSSTPLDSDTKNLHEVSENEPTTSNNIEVSLADAEPKGVSNNEPSIPEEIADIADEVFTPSGTLTVHYINVDQGDATLLQGPDFTILIDTGRHDRNEVVPYLKSAGVHELDLLIGTHPHADHIGQMDKVINSFQVDEVWMSVDEATTKTFERVLDAILDSDASYYEPKRGESFEIGSASILVLSPEHSYGDLNEGSLAMKITYGDIDFIFTGDAEKEAESDMIKSGLDLSGHIFQAGHHGSVTSNTQAFLDKVQPEVVIYSAGAANSYGHPHAEVIQRLKDMKVIIYGTDSHGHITVTTDGKDYEVTTNKIATISVGELTENQFADVEPIPVDEEIQTADHVASGSSCNSGQVNINTADLEDIKKIKHISDKRGSDLISLRPFNTLDDLKRISGIADGRLKDIKEEGIACIE